jgi:Cys-tRNA(Pro)/Cys-tRNA(Cys) deacylase
MKKEYPVYMEESCILFDHIFVSAGVRGLQFKIAPDELIRAIDCDICELI